MAIIPATTNPKCFGPKTDMPVASIEFEREPRRWWWPFGRRELRARLFLHDPADTESPKQEIGDLYPSTELLFARLAQRLTDPAQRRAVAIAIASSWWWPIIGEAEEARLMLKLAIKAKKLLDRTANELFEARKEIAELKGWLATAMKGVNECMEKGLVSTSLRTADGVEIGRGDNAFLGSEPERRLILIDEFECMDYDTRRMYCLPIGVPMFSRRDRARAWKRAQLHPISPSPAAEAAPAPRDATVSPAPAGVGTPAGARAESEPMLPIEGLCGAGPTS